MLYIRDGKSFTRKNLIQLFKSKSILKPTGTGEPYFWNIIMVRRKISNPVLEESENEEKLSEEEEEEEEVNPKREKQVISEYEKQRLSRIAENRARMEALGLTKMASSLMGSSRNSNWNSSKLKGKRKVVEEDEEYLPIDDEDHEDDHDDKVECDNDDDDDDDDEDFLGKKTSRSQSRQHKVKNKNPKPKKKAPAQKHLDSSDYVDGDEELMKAIALSLQDSGEAAGAGHTDLKDATLTERNRNARSKRKQSFTSRMQMTEDEMVMHFFHFDEAGKGSISLRDLRRVAIAHDFMWTDKELSDMIHFFDGDDDGKLNLDDFRKIASRCNMLRTSVYS